MGIEIVAEYQWEGPCLKMKSSSDVKFNIIVLIFEMLNTTSNDKISKKMYFKPEV